MSTTDSRLVAERLQRIDRLMTRAANGSSTAEGIILHQILHDFEKILAVVNGHGYAGDGPKQYALYIAFARVFHRATKEELRTMVLDVFPHAPPSKAAG